MVDGRHVENPNTATSLQQINRSRKLKITRCCGDVQVKSQQVDTAYMHEDVGPAFH